MSYHHNKVENNKPLSPVPREFQRPQVRMFTFWSFVIIQMSYRCSLNGYTFCSHYPIWIWFFFSLQYQSLKCHIWVFPLVLLSNIFQKHYDQLDRILQFMLLCSFSGPILHSLSFIWCCSFTLLIVYWTLWYVRIFHKSRKPGGNFKLSDTHNYPLLWTKFVFFDFSFLE